MRSTDKVIKTYTVKENIHSVLLSVSSLLKKRPESRSHEEINSIVFALKYIDLMRNLYEKYGQCAEDLSLKHIKYLKYNKPTTLLNSGGTLDAFYIILSGNVDVIGIDNHFSLPEGFHTPRSYAFGEWPKSDPNLNNVKIICNERTELAMISHSHLKEIIEKGKMQNKITFISSLSFGKGLTEYRMSLLLNKFKLQKYRRNDTIFYEKEINENIFIVKKGEIKLYKQLLCQENTSVKKENVSPLQLTKHKLIKNVEFLILGRGQIFGEESFHMGAERQISAICSSAKASVYKISYEDFKQNFLGNSDNKQNFEKTCDFKMKWRQDRLQEIKQSNNRNHKLFENNQRHQTRESVKLNLSNFESQPQLKALQRQMRLSMEGSTSLIIDLDSSELVDKSAAGHGNQRKNFKRTQYIRTSVKSKNVHSSVLFQENSLNSSLHLVDDHKMTGSKKELINPYIEEQSLIFGLRNGRKIQKASENVNNKHKKSQDRPASIIFRNKILQKLNKSNISTQIEDKNLSRSSLSYINKETSVSSIHNLKNDSPEISIHQTDLFRSIQGKVNTTSKKVTSQGYIDNRHYLSEKKEAGFKRYCGSNQTSFSDLMEVAARNSELDCVNFLDNDSVGLKEQTALQNVLEKVMPEKSEPERKNKLNSDLLNYSFSSKLHINNHNIHTIFKSNGDSKNKQRRISKVIARNMAHLSQDEAKMLRDLEENQKLQV